MSSAPMSYRSEKTRRELLESAYEEIWRSGFRAASLEQILSQAGVTKGALYHHFRNKLALGYAVVDEVLRERMRLRWIEPMAAADDPIEALRQLLDGGDTSDQRKRLLQGCPLNNLVQEMSGIDEEFRVRVNAVLKEWRDAIATALRRGQERGLVRENIQPEHAALFILAVIEGASGLAKCEQDAAICAPCFEGLHHYLDALRPRRAFRG